MMELPDALLELLAPLAVGEALEGAVLLRASTELGLRLTFEIDRELVHVEVFPDDADRPHAARSEQLLFAYRAGGIDSKRGQALCHAVAQRAKLNEARVLAMLAAKETATRVREITGGSLLELVGSRAHPWFTLSPYVGCLIGCRFCYAQNRVAVARKMRGLDAAPWGSYVDARVDAREVLARELRSAPLHPIKLCPIVSDPYQAVEARLQITRGCLETLRDAPPRPVLVLTRARLIERDLDLFETMPEVQVGFSLPTLDDSIRAFFEPRGAPIDARIEVLRKARARGVKTFAVVQPMLPGDPSQLADALAEVADSASLDVLRGEENAASLFDQHPAARTEGWQRARLAELEDALDQRGVARWRGELPPDLMTGP